MIRKACVTLTFYHCIHNTYFRKLDLELIVLFFSFAAKNTILDKTLVAFSDQSDLALVVSSQTKLTIRLSTS